MREASTESLPSRHDRDARADNTGQLHAGAPTSGSRRKRHNRLALHVRAHERAVRVVVLEERGSCDAATERRSASSETSMYWMRSGVESVNSFCNGSRRAMSLKRPLPSSDARVRLCDHVLGLVDRREGTSITSDAGRR